MFKYSHVQAFFPNTYKNIFGKLIKYYVVVIVDGSVKLVTKATFLHNTKVTSSKMG